MRARSGRDFGVILGIVAPFQLTRTDVREGRSAYQIPPQWNCFNSRAPTYAKDVHFIGRSAHVFQFTRTDMREDQAPGHSQSSDFNSRAPGCAKEKLSTFWAVSIHAHVRARDLGVSEGCFNSHAPGCAKGSASASIPTSCVSIHAHTRTRSFTQTSFFVKIFSIHAHRRTRRAAPVCKRSTYFNSRAPRCAKGETARCGQQLCRASTHAHLRARRNLVLAGYNVHHLFQFTRTDVREEHPLYRSVGA